MDLTGSTETFAKGVLMHVASRAPRPGDLLMPGPSPARVRATPNVLLSSVLAAYFSFCSFAFGGAETNHVRLSPLSMAEAINLGLSQSADILRAQKMVEAQEGVAIQTRAIGLPKAAITGNYGAVQPSNVDTPPVDIPNFTFGTEQSWRTQIRVVQSLYEGGRILSAGRAARLLRDRAMVEYQVAVANLVFDVQRAYYAVLLSEQQVVVREASVKLLERELADTSRRFEAGTVPRFNVLRAEVELANSRPNLSRARNQLRITRDALARLLALSAPGQLAADFPFFLTTAFDADPLNLELSRAIAVAFEQRKELTVLRKSQALRKEDIAQARAGYLPALEAFAGYDAHSTIFDPDLTAENHGWITGVQLRWDIFDGLLTRGRVKQAKAQYDLAGIELDDAFRRIELEVRTAHSTFLEAGEVLESQRKVQEQAEEALRLANSRAEAGSGTQLDVLSAQTALTEARTTQIHAQHAYVVARAGLEHAMGINIPGAPTSP